MIRRISAWAGKKPAVSRRGDNGFTLVELLVVLVILPLIIGAVAEAIIVSFENQPSTSNRLSDTTNATITTEYFVRDVEGAAEVCAPPTSSGPQPLSQLCQTSGSPYSQSSPEVCGSSNSDTLLAALYRPAVAGSAALDVGYWLHTSNSVTQVVRYSCTLQGDFSSTSPVSEVLVVPPPGTLAGNAGSQDAVSAQVDITPGQFDAAAWTNTVAQTEVLSVGSNPPILANAHSIAVASTSGFTSGTLSVATSLGTETVTCTGVQTAPPSFSGCTSSGSGAVTSGALLTQSSVSAVQLAVTQPASSYNFNILGAPRGAASSLSSPGSGGPTLLAFGSKGIGLTGKGNPNCTLGNNNAKVCVTGDIVIDGGTIDCGTSSIYASGGIQTSGAASTVNCGSENVTQTSPVSDPIAASLPSCFATSVPLPPNPSADSSGYAVPGIYTSTLSGSLEPGVYVAEGGVGSIQSATASPSDPYFSKNSLHSYDSHSGILIYVPGIGPYPAGCITVTSPQLPNATFDPAGADVVPLTSSQSAYYFFGNTALGDMWVWQDRTNPNDLMSGSGNLTFCSGKVSGANFNSECTQSTDADASTIYGLVYAPSALVDIGGNYTITTGRMYVAGVSNTHGTPGVTLSGE
jgi:prepilin-type N-terminal cleavage/methylation domain-containing protein